MYFPYIKKYFRTCLLKLNKFVIKNEELKEKIAEKLITIQNKFCFYCVITEKGVTFNFMHYMC